MWSAQAEILVKLRVVGCNSRKIASSHTHKICYYKVITFAFLPWCLFAVKISYVLSLWLLVQILDLHSKWADQVTRTSRQAKCKSHDSFAIYLDTHATEKKTLSQFLQRFFFFFFKCSFPLLVLIALFGFCTIYLGFYWLLFINHDWLQGPHPGEGHLHRKALQ